MLCSAVESTELADLERSGVYRKASVSEECTPRCTSSKAASADGLQYDRAQRSQTTNESRHLYCDIDLYSTRMGESAPSLPMKSLGYAYCEGEMNNPE